MRSKQVLKRRWRTGRKLGRTIYAFVGVFPSDDDVLIGMMDDAEVAKRIVVHHNASLTARSR